jgi:hypothetical protein
MAEREGSGPAYRDSPAEPVAADRLVSSTSDAAAWVRLQQRRATGAGAGLSGLDVGAVLRLQRSIGNAATTALLRPGSDGARVRRRLADDGRQPGVDDRGPRSSFAPSVNGRVVREPGRLLQRSPLSELRARISESASDREGYAEFGKITDAELEQLYVDDLRALWRSTSALIASIEATTTRPDKSEPDWARAARRFITRRLKPIMATKLQPDEIGNLFWPMVEHVKNHLEEGRVKWAFLKVLPDTKRYVSQITGNTPAALEPSSEEGKRERAEQLKRVGVIGDTFERKRIEWSLRKQDDPVPSQWEVFATFDDAPRVFAALMQKLVSDDVMTAFMSLTDQGEDPGLTVVGESLARTDKRVKRLGGALITRLRAKDRVWQARTNAFYELNRIEGGAMPRVVKWIRHLVTKLAGDHETVMSCYWTADDEEDRPPESSQALFERALAKLTEERAGGGDPSPLIWPTWEARLSGGEWTEVEIIAERDGRYRVHPIGLTSEYDEVVALEDLRPKSEWSKGDEAMIEWDGALFPGRVLEVDGEWVRVHWYGYPESAQGGWIRASRLRVPGW